MEAQLLNLLLVAPNCDGNDVGEAWIAFQWVKRLARRHRVTLLTYHKLGKTPAARQLSGVEVVEWPEPRLFSSAERLNSLLKPGYVPFYFRARRWIRQALGSGRTFDIAHQLAPVALRYPSPLAGLELPYVLGPVGGSLDAPPGLARDRDTAPWYVGLRRFDRLRLRFDPLLRKTYEQADCVIGIAPYVRNVLDGLSPRRLEFLADTGVEALPPPVDRSAHSGPVRLLFVGRLIKTKGVREAIRALARLPDAPVVLDIVGDGFDRVNCEQIAAQAGLAGRVVFHGRKSREEVDAFYRSADIFVFPSYREPGGIAPVEAMAWGLPLIVSNWGGPAASVDDTCGIRIDPRTPEQFASDLAQVIKRLVHDRDLRLSLGAGARERVAKTALWDEKILVMERLYEEVLLDRARGRSVLASDEIERLQAQSA
jgi:glycosyltransferase involved in cell wall biosynthesis